MLCNDVLISATGCDNYSVSLPEVRLGSVPFLPSKIKIWTILKVDLSRQTWCDVLSDNSATISTILFWFTLARDKKRLKQWNFTRILRSLSKRIREDDALLTKLCHWYLIWNNHKGANFSIHRKSRCIILNMINDFICRNYLP